jgi:hypothetical protein
MNASKPFFPGKVFPSRKSWLDHLETTALWWAMFLLVSAFYPPDLLANVYQARDIWAAKDFYSGNWIWYGPDLTGGGKLPGPFYYILIGLPLRWFGDFTVLYYFQNALAATGFCLLWKAMANKYNDTAAELALAFLSTSFIFITTLATSWNPSYLILFQGFIVYMVLSKKRRSLKFSMLMGFAIGLSLQIHYSMWLFFLGVILIYLSDSLSGIRDQAREAIKAAIVFMALALVPLLPFVVVSVFQPNSSGVSMSTASGVMTFMGIVGELGLAGSLVNGLKRLTELLRTHAMADVTFVVAILAGFAAFQTHYSKRKELLILVAASVLVLPWYFAKSELGRYLLCLSVAFSCLAAAGLSEFRFARIWLCASAGLVLVIRLSSLEFAAVDGPSWVPIALATLCFLWFYGLRYWRGAGVGGMLAFVGIAGWSVFVQTEQSPYKTWRTGQLAETLEPIQSATRWSYAEFRKRTFMTGLALEFEDLSVLYEHMRSKSRTSSQQGFSEVTFATIRAKESHPHYSKSQDFIPQEIIEDIEQGGVVLLQSIETSNYQIRLYGHKLGRNDIYWNNIGNAYQNEDLRLTGFEVKTLSRCEIQDANCQIQVGIRKLPPDGLLVAMVGNPIGMLSPPNNPAWVAALEDVGIEFSCQDALVKKHLVKRIGYHQDYASSFQSPYSRELRMPCPNPARIKIAVGGGASYIHDFKVEPIARQELIWEIEH